MTDQMINLLGLLRGVRFSLESEKHLQFEIKEKLKENNILFERERHLSNKDIIDFLIPGVGAGIEVKIKGGKMAIYRQVERYTTHIQIKSIILFTTVSMGFPPEINGKPIYVINPNKAWL